LAGVQAAVLPYRHTSRSGHRMQRGRWARQIWRRGAPETQRAAILARAHADGYLMDEADIYEDHARGHKLTRKGYVSILRGVREGRYGAVYAFMLDRWGRDSIERQTRGKELDKLGVPLISVLEGVDEPGLVRVIRAELVEE